MLKKIVILGPESTGKSTLCQQLADHFKTIWVPEYAREYLEKNGTSYQYEDLEKIAIGQLTLEEKYLEDVKNHPTYKDHHLLFIDTDMYVMKVWSEFVFGKCDNKILTAIAQRTYDLYLLCNIDLPWVKDHLREYPDLERREQLFHFYKDAMINQRVPWAVISGNYEERLAMAIENVENIFLPQRR